MNKVINHFFKKMKVPLIIIFAFSFFRGLSIANSQPYKGLAFTIFLYQFVPFLVGGLTITIVIYFSKYLDSDLKIKEEK